MTDWKHMPREDLEDIARERMKNGKPTRQAKRAQNELYERDRISTWDGRRPKTKKTLDWYDHTGRDGER